MLSNKQKEVLNDDSTASISVGTIRSGKTFCAALAFGLFTQTLDKPYSHIIAGRKLRVMEAEILPVLNQVAEMLETTLHYTRFDSRARIGNQTYVLAAGNDEKSKDMVMGLTVHSVLIDEATEVPETFFDAVMSRMSFADSRSWTTCNPSHPMHYLKEKWIDGGRFDEVREFTFEDNPTLSDAVKERYRAMFSGVFAARMVNGLWSQGEGVVYPNFTVYDDSVGDPGQPFRVDIGVDYGTASTTAFVALASYRTKGEFDKGWMIKKRIIGEMLIKGGSDKINKTDQELAEALQEFATLYKAKFVYIDPSASSFRAELLRVKNRKFAILKANNKVNPGIRVVMNALTHETITIAASCKHLLKELKSYTWHATLPDTVIKENDHFCDAMRYVVVGQMKDFVSNPTLPDGV